MSLSTNAQDYGPSWSDVWGFRGRLMELHEWAIVIEMSEPPSGPFRQPRGSWVRCVARQRAGEADLYRELATGQLWPASGYRTMPALLMALLQRLAQKLEGAAAEGTFGHPLRGLVCPTVEVKNDLLTPQNGT